VFIEALRTIQPGEELKYDYSIGRARSDPPNVDEILCLSLRCAEMPRYHAVAGRAVRHEPQRGHTSRGRAAPASAGAWPLASTE
jgi:hypothetical protein